MSDKVYRVVCPGCGQYLGSVYARHADHLVFVHAPHCPITEAQHAQAIEDMKFAEVTGYTQHLRNDENL